MKTITSPGNPTARYLRSLSRRKSREESGEFLIEGDVLLEEALAAGIEITAVLVEQSRAENFGALIDRAEKHGAQIYEASVRVMEQVSELSTPQSLIAAGKIPALSGKLKAGGKYIACEEMQNPGNLGAILRTAAAFGMDGVLLCGGCDLFSGKTLRGSMGAVFKVPVFIYENIASMKQALSAEKITLYGAVLSKEAAPLHQVQFAGGCAVLIGNEGNGLTDAAIAACDKEIYIPMRENTESLNAAVAGALFMWEMSR